MENPRTVGLHRFLHPEEAVAAREAFMQAGGRKAGLRFAVGLRTSYRMVHRLPYRGRAFFPRIDDLSAVFGLDADVWRVLAYSDSTPHGTDLAESLALAAGFAGPRLNAFLLDIVWPNPDQLRLYRHAQFDRARAEGGRRIHIVLRIGADAVAAVGGDASALSERIDPYVRRGLIDGLRLDVPSPEGVPAFRSRAVTLAATFPALSIIASGGRDPQAAEAVRPLVGLVPTLSLDAPVRGRGRLDQVPRAPDVAGVAEYFRWAIPLLY